MQRNPVLIAKEYAQPTEPVHVRRNALTALAVLGGPESWMVLINAALTDCDASVREHAEDELGRLEPEARAQAIVPVLDSVSNPAKQQAAYALLGRLRTRGIQFTFPSLPISTRLSLARAMRQLVPTRGVTFHLRTWKGALIGVASAWVTLLLFCSIGLDMHVQTESALGVLLLALMFTTVVVVPATALSSPIRYYADVGGGAALDIATATVVALGFAAFTVFAWTDKGAAFHPWPLILLAPCLAVAIRTGGLSVFGLRRPAWQNFVVEMAVGGACGAAVYEVALFASSGDNVVLNESWYLVLLTSFGLAGAYAWIDRQPEPRSLVSRRQRIAVLSLAAIAVLIPLLLVKYPLVPEVAVSDETGSGHADLSAEPTFARLASGMSWRKLQARAMPGTIGENTPRVDAQSSRWRF